MDKESAVPLYYQLREILLQRIGDKTLKIGDQIPSERELEQEYGLSRTTVRRAIESLVVDGYLKKDHGRGTFVAMPKLRRTLVGPSGFSESMRSLGYNPSSKLLAIERLIPPKRIVDALHVPEDQPVLKFDRLRLTNDIPLSLHTVYLPLARGIDVSEAELAQAGDSLYGVLLYKYNLVPIEAEEIIGATVASKEQAQLLSIKEGAPLLYIQRITYGETGPPFELSETLYRGDRYQSHHFLSTRGEVARSSIRSEDVTISNTLKLQS